MQLMQLKSVVRTKKYRAFRGAVGRIAPNVLQRQFDARGPNQKWGTDITEFRVGDQKLYLSPIMDLYNNEIVSYEMATRPVFSMAARMLKKALERLGADEHPVVHSDQGWHYQMRAYQALLSGRALTQSMSRRGNCLDTQFTIRSERRFDLTRATTGRAAFALTCRSDPAFPERCRAQCM